MKKPGGGQYGNLNASKRPWDTFWRRRALKGEDRWILPILTEYSASLESDNPGMSAAEKRMAELAQLARGCTMLILGAITKHGFTRHDEIKGFDLHPGAKDLPRFFAAERNALKDLGLERRCAEVPSLGHYLESVGEVIEAPTVIAEPRQEDPAARAKRLRHNAARSKARKRKKAEAEAAKRALESTNDGNHDEPSIVEPENGEGR